MPRIYYKRPAIRVIGPSIAYIALTGGHFSVVDRQDAELLQQHNWSACNNGFQIIALRRDANGMAISMHGSLLPKKDGMVIDHKNRCSLHNFRGNLRYANKSQNAINSKVRSNNKSGYSGISWDRRREKWKVAIAIEGNYRLIGRRTNLEDAVALRRSAELEHYGKFRPHC